MRVKIDVERVQIGMYVAELDRPWLDSPFLFQGFLVSSTTELDELQTNCRYVFVDDVRSDPKLDFTALGMGTFGNAKVQQRRGDRPIGPGKDSRIRMFSSDLDHARTTRNVVRGKIVQLLAQLRSGSEPDLAEVESLVEDMVGGLSGYPDTMLWLTNLKNKHEYTADHCMNVAVLSVAFGRHLGLDRGELETIGMGGLLHDVGKMRTPVEILDKPGWLTREEFEIMKLHPVEGYNVLRASRAVPELPLRIVKHHHERVNGAGYPDGLTGDAIPLPVLIVAMADTYDAMTSDRIYHDGMPPHDALRQIYRRADNDFGQTLVQEFIRCLGTYPSGTAVRLSNGSVGVVMSSSAEARLQPLVLVVRGPDGEELQPRALLNLAAVGLSREGKPSIYIDTVLDPKAAGLDITALVSEDLQTS